VVVLAAVVVIPVKLHGYGAVFAAADQAFQAKGGATGLLLKPAQMLPFATLALGSALAAFMYPHTMTGVLSSSSAGAIRKNAMLLPAYTVLLGLIALLGYMAIAAGIHVKQNTEVVPALFSKIFPSWFIGFSFAAIAIGALVPAAIMSIGAANLFTRNVWRPFVEPRMSPAKESKVAKIVSLLVKVGALGFILFLAPQFAIELQLLGGIWILQILPGVTLGLYHLRLHWLSLLVGWAIGMTSGTYLATLAQMKPVFGFHVVGQTWSIYIGLIALGANLLFTGLCSLAIRGTRAEPVVAEAK
jgi:SSS family solute:Na+ symporter